MRYEEQRRWRRYLLTRDSYFYLALLSLRLIPGTYTIVMV